MLYDKAQYYINISNLDQNDNIQDYLNKFNMLIVDIIINIQKIRDILIDKNKSEHYFDIFLNLCYKYVLLYKKINFIINLLITDNNKNYINIPPAQDFNFDYDFYYTQ